MTPDDAQKQALAAAGQAGAAAHRAGQDASAQVAAAITAYERALWQPIATAPPDEIEVYVPARRYSTGQIPDVGWVGQSAPGDMLRQEATHWRPLSVRPGESD